MIEVTFNDLNRSVIYRSPNSVTTEYGVITGFDVTTVFICITDEATRQITRKAVSRRDLQYDESHRRNSADSIFQHRELKP